MKGSSLKLLERFLLRYPMLCSLPIEECVIEIVKCYSQKKKILICGNGGSAADSLHIVGELMKGFLMQRKLDENTQKQIVAMFPEESKYFIDNLQCAIPAISLVNEMSLLTAYCNDKAPDLVFAQQVLGHGNEGDILFAISTSGNSKNVVYAAQIAKFKKMRIISLTGNKAGALVDFSDIVLAVPSNETYIIQEYHLPVYHALCAIVENEIFATGDI